MRILWHSLNPELLCIDAQEITNLIHGNGAFFHSADLWTRTVAWQSHQKIRTVSNFPLTKITCQCFYTAVQVQDTHKRWNRCMQMKYLWTWQEYTLVDLPATHRRKTCDLTHRMYLQGKGGTDKTKGKEWQCPLRPFLLRHQDPKLRSGRQSSCNYELVYFQLLQN